jgi:hypothetical protein
MAHVLLRNRTTKAVWPCPEGVVDHYLANGWMKAAKDAEPTDEQPAAAPRDTPKEQ